MGFGHSHELAADPHRVLLDNIFARNVYKLAQTLDEWPGEDYPGTSCLAGAKALKQMAMIKEYRWAFGIDDVLATLSHFGPVVVATDWLDGMFSPNPAGLLDVSGSVAGGHCYLVRGHIFKHHFKGMRGWHHVVRIRNSWGIDWGQRGDAFITVEDFDRLLSADGESCVLTELT